MRLRMLRQATTPFGAFHAGDIADVPDSVAKSWCESGIAMQEKSAEPKESKDIDYVTPDLYWCAQCGCSHRRSSKIGQAHMIPMTTGAT